MNELTYASEKTIFSILQQAYDLHFISKDRVNQLYQELETFLKELVFYFTHGSSTSLSKKNYQRIWETLHYMFRHGCRDLHSLQENGIRDLFYQGLASVKKDVSEIQKIYRHLLSMKLPFQNDNYLSILHEQVPGYLKSLQGYYRLFHYCHIDYDLDYPLFDGYPLYHDMYGLEGSDLVLYYLKRLNLETTFCLQYDQLTVFIQQYEEAKGIGIQELGINLFEIVLYQAIGYFLLYHEKGLLLTKVDVERMKHQFNTSLSKSILEALHHVHKSNVIKDYILSFQDQIINQFKNFFDNDNNLLIIPLNDEDVHLVVLNPSTTNSSFLKTLNELQSMTHVEDKINYLHQIQVNLYDLVDLFENHIFMEEEYMMYFSSLSSFDLALLIQFISPSLKAFHPSVLDLIGDLDDSIEWQEYLIYYLNQISVSRKKEIETIIHHIKIKNNR